MKKIAFCFLIYDIINHEDLWEAFFRGVDVGKYSIYIHYKLNVPLKHLDKYKLENCVDTKWGDISLVKAQDVLLGAALKDEDNKLFVFLSNSCVPLKSFDHVYEKLDTSFSYFCMAPQTKCFPRCDAVLQFVGKQSIQKASQWCILNRKHVELLLNSAEYLTWFNDVFAADEHCYVTFLFHKQLQNELIIADWDDPCAGATTFVNWHGNKYKYPSTNKLKNYDSITKEELSYLLNSPCLFGRKFTTKCNFNSIYNANKMQISNMLPSVIEMRKGVIIRHSNVKKWKMSLD
jgi:hypothetical protein